MLNSIVSCTNGPIFGGLCMLLMLNTMNPITIPFTCLSCIIWKKLGNAWHLITKSWNLTKLSKHYSHHQHHLLLHPPRCLQPPPLLVKTLALEKACERPDVPQNPRKMLQICTTQHLNNAGQSIVWHIQTLCGYFSALMKCETSWEGHFTHRRWK